MARFPGAIWRPITAPKGRKALAVHNRVNLHVAVSEAASLHGAFNKSGVPDSHFYVRRDGTVEQYVDTSERAFADLDGNDATISVETQGGVKHADAELWTHEQLETLARIYAWAVTTHDVELRLATDSKIGASSKGLSWHRLGIDGTFPDLPDPRAGRAQRGGGMHYSTSRGKLCPGGAKIQQIPSIYTRARKILAGAPTTPQEDNMPTVTDIWSAPVTRGGKKVPIIQEIADIKTTVLANAGQVAALTAAVNALAKGQGINPAVIEDAARRGVADALASIETTITVKGNDLA